MTMKNIRKLHLYGVLMSTYAKHLDSVVRALTLLTLLSTQELYKSTYVFGPSRLAQNWEKNCFSGP